MKKIISLLFAILVPVLMFTACADKTTADTSKAPESATVKGKEFTAGVYFMTSDVVTSRSVQLQIRDDYKIAIQYNHKTTTESGKYSIDGDILTANIEKTGCVYVFNIKDGKLYFDQHSSTPSDKFLSDSGIINGTEFYLDHGFEKR